MPRVRWSDRDRYFGPFTYAPNSRSYNPLAVILSSGDGDERPGCSLRLSGFGHTLIVALPPIIRPWRRWVDTSRHAWSSSRGGYWDTGRREYGISIFDGFVNLSLGRVTNDSRTEQRRGYFLPWKQWRHVRLSLYGLDGGHFWTDTSGDKGFSHLRFEERRAAKDACPSRTFAFADFDGEALTARTYIEEREWRFGTGWFRWLSLFRRPKISRSLAIEFSGETGRRKGSWKGGTIAHGIEMLPGELHEAAFRRYCEQNSMKMEDC